MQRTHKSLVTAILGNSCFGKDQKYPPLLLWQCSKDRCLMKIPFINFQKKASVTVPAFLDLQSAN